MADIVNEQKGACMEEAMKVLKINNNKIKFERKEKWGRRTFYFTIFCLFSFWVIASTVYIANNNSIYNYILYICMYIALMALLLKNYQRAVSSLK